MKVIHARVRNGRLTDPTDRHNLDEAIAEGHETRYAVVIVFDRGDGDAVDVTETLGSIMVTPSRGPRLVGASDEQGS